MIIDTIKHLGAEFHRAADSLADTLARLDNARLDRLAFLRRCSKESTARLAAIKEELRALPVIFMTRAPSVAALRAAEDLLRRALEPAQEQPKPEPYRAGLPPERLRTAWAQWEEKDSGLVDFRGNEYRGTMGDGTRDQRWRPMAELGGFADRNLWAFRPHGATWARVEAMADEKERALPRPVENCGHVAADGTCGHPNAQTPECHDGVVCPVKAAAPKMLDLRTVRDDSNHTDPDVVMADADLFDAGESAATKAPLIRKGETFTVEREVSDHGKGPRVKVTREGQGQCYIAALQPAHVVPTPPTSTLLDLTKLPPGTVCEATGQIARGSHVILPGERFAFAGSSTEFLARVRVIERDESFDVPTMVHARVVKEGGEQ